LVTFSTAISLFDRPTLIAPYYLVSLLNRINSSSLLLIWLVGLFRFSMMMFPV